MATTFEIKQNDRRPFLRYNLTQGPALNPVPADLTGQQGVWFIMRNSNGTVVVNAPADVVDEEQGVVQYEWAEGDTEESGAYECEFEVAFGAGRTETMTFPSSGYFPVKINDDIA